MWSSPKPDGVAHALSIDGSRLALAEGGTLTLIDTNTGDISDSSVKYNGSAISAVTFNNDGSRLAIGTDDGQLDIWDVQHGSRLSSYSTEVQQPITAITFTSDGQWLLCGQRGQISRFDVQTGDRLSQNHDRVVFTIATCPENELLAVASDFGIDVYDLSLIHI